MDLHADYDAKDADAHLDKVTQEASLTFLTPEGWVGVRLGRADLEALQARISRELSSPKPPAQRR
jgi:hypothetical protein